MKTHFNFLLAIGLLFSVYACYPGGAEYVDELDTSISKYDPAYDWDALDGKTYSLPEEILYVKDGEEVERPNRVHDENILKQMREELGKLGMNEADADTSLAIAIVIIEQNNSGAAWVPGGGWWGGWYPGYPGWGWGGWYPWYPVYYNYKTGSIIIEMADYESRDVEKKTAPLVYTGALDGLMQGSQSYTASRIERGIDELFNQAPF
ncbi:DUF4136 domain-containing protein [Carboxylicivirga mesophila]|uniref:DUF4136 domain-containing protein n=1 Tax=Carboxylicivirga mesophila TaxID=1166478 RepID=A0ABS5K681_9BACT|nr:DUF4136 domain-containing protein [Carboxylicivirga mesophila]MBS2210461.1 DUF4136 domain-containing protein [Carboxylicivirga mesophila]